MSDPPSLQGNEDEETRAETCKRCGGENPSWAASSPLWNAVMRGGSINGEPEWEDMVCATCFMVLAEEKGIASLFRVTADHVTAILETTTPSGRVWDEDRFLWIEPASPPSVDQGEPRRWILGGRKYVSATVVSGPGLDRFGPDIEVVEAASYEALKDELGEARARTDELTKNWADRYDAEIAATTRAEARASTAEAELEEATRKLFEKQEQRRFEAAEVERLRTGIETFRNEIAARGGTETETYALLSSLLSPKEDGERG